MTEAQLWDMDVISPGGSRQYRNIPSRDVLDFFEYLETVPDPGKYIVTFEPSGTDDKEQS